MMPLCLKFPIKHCWTDSESTSKNLFLDFCGLYIYKSTWALTWKQCERKMFVLSGSPLLHSRGDPSPLQLVTKMRKPYWKLFVPKIITGWLCIVAFTNLEICVVLLALDESFPPADTTEDIKGMFSLRLVGFYWEEEKKTTAAWMNYMITWI